MQADNSDRYPLVNLEITIPHLLLPTPVEGVSVRLLYLDTQEGDMQSVTSAEVTEHAVQQFLFRLFHLRSIPTRARYLLLQVLQPPQVRAARVSDQLALTLELRRPDPAQRGRLSHVELTPGVQSVVIFLDEEGLPQSSSIDGAQI